MASKMNLQEAAVILRRHQDWRTGKDIRTLTDTGMDPHELTVAIDTILSHFGLPKPLLNCTRCRYRNKEDDRCDRITGIIKTIKNYTPPCELKGEDHGKNTNSK